MKIVSGAAALMSALGLFTTAMAQSPAQPPPAEAPSSAPSPAPTPVCCIAPGGAAVLLELTDELGTKGHKPGDYFGIRLAEPLKVNGKVVIPAGALGQGQIIDVGRPGMSGKPAKLILAARWIDAGGVRVPLHAFRLGGLGESNTNAATALAFAPYVGILSLAVTGGDLNYPIGQKAWALTRADTVVPSLADSPSPPSFTPTAGAPQ